MKKNLLYILLVLLFSIPALLPLFHKGFFLTDDGEWMIIRFSAFYSALRDGQVPPRFLHALNSGYGYPVPTFLYPGYMYFGVPIQLITSSFVSTIKLILGLSLIGSAIFTYFWLSKFFSKIGSFIGALVSLYLPYHLYDTYTRGSVGEILALVWIPFTLWMIERKNIFFSAIGITFLILSHNTLALLFLPIICFYMIAKLISNPDKQKQIIYRYIIILLTGIGMASFFVIPAITELFLTNFSQTKVSNPFSYFADLNKIGIISVFIFTIALVTFFLKLPKIKNYRNILILFFVISSISIFLSISYSAFVWKIMPVSWIQFPFRILSYLVLTIPFLTAFIFTQVKGTTKIVLLFLAIGTMTTSALPFSSPKEFFDKGDAYYFTNSATTTVQDEYMPVWVKQKPQTHAEKKIEIVKGEGKIQNVFFNNKRISFTADIKKDALIRINTIYWPGWKAFVNEKNAVIDYKNNSGVIDLFLPKANHSVQLIFGETTSRLFADFLSIISFILLLFFSIKKKLYN